MFTLMSKRDLSNDSDDRYSSKQQLREKLREAINKSRGASTIVTAANVSYNRYKSFNKTMLRQEMQSSNF